MRIVITGASGALGHAVVEAFAEKGDAVAAIDRIGSAAFPESVVQIACPDLGDPDAAAAAMAQAADALGGIDGLVCLAGGFEWLPVGQSRVEDWRCLFSGNVETALCAIQAVLPMLARDSSILCVGAASAEPAGAGMAPYGAAKSGVARLVEALSRELKETGIRVNAILPAIIDTPRNRQDMPDADPADWTSPAAVAEVAVFLSGHGARAINGAHIPVTNNR